eukprot:jgi/Orpsp1_1/1178765/evm.model.c7180000066650.1
MKKEISSFYLATESNDVAIVKVLIDYANSHNIHLNINERNEDEDYPLLNATFKNNIEIINLLMEYADNNDMILNITKQNKRKNYTLDWAVSKNNLEMVKLLLEYAKKTGINMNINLKNENGNYPILYAINNNNIEMIKCLVEYAKYQNIILRINENDITNPKEVKEDIISLLLDYEDKQIIIIECDNERIFLKKKIEKSNNNEEEEEELPEYSQNQPNYVQYPYIPNFIPNVIPPGMYVPPGGQYVLLPNGQYYFQQFGQPNLIPVNMPPQYNNS